MIYIYEGVDGSGKSTRARDDARAMGIPYVHNPVDWRCKHPFKEWKKFLETYQGKSICVDRSFLSNPVYHKWFKDDPDFTKEEMTELSQYEFVVVYCESGTEYQDATARGEDNLKTAEDYDLIKYYYSQMLEELITRFGKKVYLYNWREDKDKSLQELTRLEI